MNTSPDGANHNDNAQKARRELLLKVYDAAINEYRFNVNLSWDRTKFFLLLNSGLIAAGVGLIKIAEDSLPASFFLVFFFLVSILIAVSGLETVSVGKRYYRRANHIKTLVERELGLLDPIPGLPSQTTLSIAVTDGQRDHNAILSNDESTRAQTESRVGSGSVVWHVRTIFWMMIAIEILGAIFAVLNIAKKIL